MSKQAVFTMKLEPELRAEFMAEAEAAHRPASQILRELMREFRLPDPVSNNQRVTNLPGNLIGA